MAYKITYIIDNRPQFVNCFAKDLEAKKLSILVASGVIVKIERI